MGLEKEVFRLEEFLRFNPINPGDPGPEIYRVVASLPQERQQAVVSVISEAVGAIANIKGAAYGKIAGIIGGKTQGGV
ncbi:hypothetical protein [Alloacidobacterium sp.]|uniref:hypothetical protein n=1 Tax=Alloacidobacterium sp. TaxID=2951999 RepID=UPI002D25AA3D|nr:hypothetical protein [Alloacidobacterium sp.]HYK36641.1 hypothetical protein [Alloacidobacterium sp.]